MARVETPAGRAVVTGGGIAVAALGACCAFHASGSNAPWLGGESSGQPPLKAALRPVRCGDSRLIPPSCNPGVSIRMGASVAALLRCRVSGDLERALCDDISLVARPIKSVPWFLIITPSSGPSTVTTSRERAACCRAELPLLHFRHISCTRLGTTSRHRPEVAPGKSSTIRCTSRFRGSGGPARIRAKPPRLHVAACRPGAWPSPASRRLARPRHTGEDPQVNRFSWVPARRSPRRLEARRARAWTRARCERC